MIVFVFNTIAPFIKPYLGANIEIALLATFDRAAEAILELEELVNFGVTELAHIGVSHDSGISWGSHGWNLGSAAQGPLGSGQVAQTPGTGCTGAQLQENVLLYIKYAKVRFWPR